MASAGKGLPFIGKLNEFIDRVLHPTVQKVGSSRAATEVISKKYYLLNPIPTTPYIAENGSSDSLVVVTAHTFKVGDLIRIKASSNPIVEHEIIIDEIIDANTVKLAGYLSHPLSSGDTFDVLRPVSERVAEDGSSLSTVVSPPIQYNRKAAGLTVPTTVTEDLDNPSDSRGLPVVIHSIDGAPIIVNAGDLSVSTSHVNDSMAIGDGTNLVGVTLNNEFKVHDADALAELQVISAIDFATEAKQDTQITALGSLLTELQLKADLTETQPVSVQSSALPTGAATEATLATLATEATALNIYNELVTIGNESVTNDLITHTKLDSIITNTTGKATEAKQDTMIASLASIASEDFATETTLAAMSAKLPSALGQGTMAQSMRVVLPSDQVVPTRENALSAGTVTDTTISGATVTTILAPVGARGMKIQAGINNTADLLVGLGGATPDNTTNIGLEFQGGRSEDIIGASNVEVTSSDPAATNQKIVIVWSYV